MQVVTPAPEDLGYSSLNLTRGPVRPAPVGGRAPQAGARQYQPAGQRFALQRDAVSWLGWTFQAGRMPMLAKTPKTLLLQLHGGGDSQALVQPHSMEQGMCAAQPHTQPRLTNTFEGGVPCTAEDLQTPMLISQIYLRAGGVQASKRAAAVGYQVWRGAHSI